MAALYAEELRMELARRKLTDAWLVANMESRSRTYLKERLRGDRPFNIDDCDEIDELLGLSMEESLMLRAAERARAERATT